MYYRENQPAYPTEVEEMSILGWQTWQRSKELFPLILQRAVRDEIPDADILFHCHQPGWPALDIVALPESKTTALREYRRRRPHGESRFFVIDAPHTGTSRIRVGSHLPHGWRSGYDFKLYTPTGQQDQPGLFGLSTPAAYNVRPEHDEVHNSLNASLTEEGRAVANETIVAHIVPGQYQGQGYSLGTNTMHDLLNGAYNSVGRPTLTDHERAIFNDAGPYALLYDRICQSLGILSTLAGQDPGQPFGDRPGPYEL